MTKRKPVKEHKAYLTRLETEMRNSIWHRIKLCETREEKEKLVEESQSLLYVFGHYLKPWKPYLSYEDNMRFRFIGE